MKVPTLTQEPSARELLDWLKEEGVGQTLASRVEKVLAKCAEMSALDKRSGFTGEGHIAIALLLRILNGETNG